MTQELKEGNFGAVEYIRYCILNYVTVLYKVVFPAPENDPFNHCCYVS